MTERVFYFIMVPMVYAAFFLLFSGLLYTLIRLISAGPQASTLKIFPVQKFSKSRGIIETFTMPVIRKDRPVFWVFLILYHIAFLILILSHIDLIPGVNFMDPESIHMIGYGAVGLTLLISVLYFLFRRFKSPVREISTPGDYLILILLFLIILSGDIISWSNSWNENGFLIVKDDFKNYFQSLVRFSFQDPSEVLAGSHYVVLVVHVFLANLFIMIFPFTKFVHAFLAIPVNLIRRG